MGPPREGDLRGETHAWLDLSHWVDRGDPGHSIVLRLAVSAAETGIMTSTYPGSTAPLERSAVAQAGAIEWGPIVAGATAAAALALVLHGFAIAVGLSVSSTAPTWRDASIALVLLSGFYVIVAAFASYGLGGYVAGLLGSRTASEPIEDVEFRDGMRGLLVWALATLLTGLIALATAQSLTRLAAPSGGQAGSTASIGGENIIAFDLDRLFRAERRTAADLEYPRAEAARVLLTTSGHRGMQPNDRAYLVRLVGLQTGLAQPDAERRVDEVAAQVRDNIARARRSAVVIAFAAAAAALLGAAAAWFAACAGGRVRHRELTPHALWNWRKPVRPT
jgi:hypothetical protein